MATSFFAALLLAASFVKAGNNGITKTPGNQETNPNAVKETITTTVEKPRTYVLSKKSVPDCISKNDVLSVYKLDSFEGIADIRRTESSENLSKSPKVKNVINNYDNISFKFADIYTQQALSTGLKAKTPLKLNPPVEKVVLVKSMTQRYDDEYIAIESEIKFLKQLENLKTSPKYHFCFYESTFSTTRPYFRYHIVQEEIGETLASQSAKEKFKTFEPHVKVYKALQIALIVQNMHTLKITHQNININNIVSADEGLTEFRLIDFTYAVEAGKTGITKVGVSPTGILKAYSTADKYADSFIATFQQDAFALAVTILHLLDEKGVFGPKITAACPQNAATLSEDCKKAYLDKNMVINDNKDIQKIVLNLQERLFGDKEVLNIGKMITELALIYKGIVNEDVKFFQTTLEVDFIEKTNKENQETIEKLVITPGNKELIVL